MVKNNIMSKFLNRKYKLSASIMCADLLNLEKEIKILEKEQVDYLHIDIMDAAFVPNLTFGPDMVNQIREITSMPFDIHLLMKNPRTILSALPVGEGDIVSIHAECDDVIMENIAWIKHRNAKFGLALNPETPIESVHKFLPYVDILLLMLIVPGFTGSTMIHGMMEKVGVVQKYLQQHGLTHVEIEVDGSVSCEKAKSMGKLGASYFVGGTTAIFRKEQSLRETIANFHIVMTK
jgi:ribulose-phosphate 3-epimerase